MGHSKAGIRAKRKPGRTRTTIIDHDHLCVKQLCYLMIPEPPMGSQKEPKTLTWPAEGLPLQQHTVAAT